MERREFGTLEARVAKRFTANAAELAAIRTSNLTQDGRVKGGKTSAKNAAGWWDGSENSASSGQGRQRTAADHAELTGLEKELYQARYGTSSMLEACYAAEIVKQPGAHEWYSNVDGSPLESTHPLDMTVLRPLDEGTGAAKPLRKLDNDQLIDESEKRGIPGITKANYHLVTIDGGSTVSAEVVAEEGLKLATHVMEAAQKGGRVFQTSECRGSGVKAKPVGAEGEAVTQGTVLLKQPTGKPSDRASAIPGGLRGIECPNLAALQENIVKDGCIRADLICYNANAPGVRHDDAELAQRALRGAARKQLAEEAAEEGSAASSSAPATAPRGARTAAAAMLKNNGEFAPRKKATATDDHDDIDDEGGVAGDVQLRIACDIAGGRAFQLHSDRSGDRGATFYTEVPRKAGVGCVAMLKFMYTRGTSHVFHCAGMHTGIGGTIVITVRAHSDPDTNALGPIERLRRVGIYLTKA